ncbi:hypothetical protein GME_03010 [Halomonas sp. TD01]|nr:hypothetical protein GME_03010 [Halomonas sp. TD01]
MPDIINAHASGAPIAIRTIMERNMIAVIIMGSKFNIGIPFA